MPKKSMNDKLARVIALELKGLERKLVDVYKGTAGLIETLRTETHTRFDRLEGFILPQYKRRVDKSERKK